VHGSRSNLLKAAGREKGGKGGENKGKKKGKGISPPNFRLIIAVPAQVNTEREEKKGGGGEKEEGKKMEGERIATSTSF